MDPGKSCSTSVSCVEFVRCFPHVPGGRGLRRMRVLRLLRPPIWPRRSPGTCPGSIHRRPVAVGVPACVPAVSRLVFRPHCVTTVSWTVSQAWPRRLAQSSACMHALPLDAARHSIRFQAHDGYGRNSRDPRTLPEKSPGAGPEMLPRGDPGEFRSLRRPDSAQNRPIVNLGQLSTTRVRMWINFGRLWQTRGQITVNFNVGRSWPDFCPIWPESVKHWTISISTNSGRLRPVFQRLYKMRKRWLTSTSLG